LVIQFLCESLVITFISALLAIAVTELALPSFNALIGKRLAIEYGNFYFWLAGFSFIFLTGILAGSYPAFFLSGFKPISVLKGSFKKINALVTPRKILVVLQFTFAIILIICTIVLTQQVKYAQGRKTGYDRHHLVHIYTNDEMDKHFGLIKNELINSGAATAVSKVQAPLTQNWSSGIHVEWEGKDPSQVIQINRYTEESDLVKTAGMELIAGRDIDIQNYPSDSTACLINESALKLMNFKNPIGQIITDDPQKWHVVGVIKDFIQESPYQPIKPIIIRGPNEWTGVILVRLNRGLATAKDLSMMEKIFKKYNPSYPFEYTFTDEEYASKFANEQLTKKLAALFAWLTIFISCLGLFGLSAYMAESRTKEIGIRKTLGASVRNITTMLSFNFMRLVAAAIVIASPVAWWAMNTWLKDYDYRIRIHWWVFALAGLVSMLIALITVSYESIKAAIANPVKSLRTE
jgi:ABC-type antimicrobial peptide transport system permease subunit